MKILERLFIFFLLPLLIGGCGGNMSEKMNVEKGPIRVFQSDEKVVDLSWIISQTDDEILKIFPEGVYQGVVLFTNCADMQNGTGRIAIDYLGTKKGWLGFGSRVYQVIAEIDTQNETLEISSSDVTDDYPIFVNHPKPTKEEFLKSYDDRPQLYKK